MQTDTTLRKPPWLKAKLPGGENYTHLKEVFRRLNLHTVCEEAQCPNVGECWGGGTATLMLLGDTCTRGCRFCAVNTGNPKGVVDYAEPERVANAISQTDLSYLVMTMVNRDDLPDGGSAIVSQAIREIKKRAPQILVEMLTGDFQGNRDAVAEVLAAKPDVFAHNIETVERLTRTVRDARADYRQSLQVLQWAKEMNPKMLTKSSIMLGCGEREEEIRQAMRDLRTVGVDFLTLGQYLRPSSKHLAVSEYVAPAKFEEFKKYGQEIGFRYVAAGPLVRSSYRAGEFYIESLIRSHS